MVKGTGGSRGLAAEEVIGHGINSVCTEVAVEDRGQVPTHRTEKGEH